MKVRCIGYEREERYFTKGKVYELNNGKITSDNGYTYEFTTNERVLEFLSRWYKFRVLKSETIVIYRKGQEVIALDKSTGKKGVAKCCSDDEFNFETGAKLAFERLFEPQVKEVKRRAKVGEYVKVINEDGSPTNEYKNGDILKIVEKPKGLTSIFPYYKNDYGKYLYDYEYVVLEGYKPPKEETDEFHHEFKEGKTYVFRREIFTRHSAHDTGWSKECDGKVVEIKNIRRGFVGAYTIHPEWCEEIDLSIGDTVKVVNEGKVYSAFATWEGLGKFEQNYVRNSIPKSNKNYKVLNIKEHGCTYDERILALIQDTDTTQVFIINIDGIKKA